VEHRVQIFSLHQEVMSLHVLKFQIEKIPELISSCMANMITVNVILNLTMISFCDLQAARFRVLNHAKIVSQNGIAEVIAWLKHLISQMFPVKEMHTDVK
jgi:hypothetical protein